MTTVTGTIATAAGTVRLETASVFKGILHRYA